MESNQFDVFSLEDEDMSDIFITQTPNSEKCNEMSNVEFIEEGIVGGERKGDVLSLQSGLHVGSNVCYSDISDPEDDFMNPIYGRTESVSSEGLSDVQGSGQCSRKSDGCGVSRIIGWNSRKKIGVPAIRGAVSNIRKFHKVAATRLQQLKTKQLKKRTFNKMQWGVRAYCDWRNDKLMDSENFDMKVFEADIKDVSKLSKQSLCHALCQFIPEVTKLHDGSDYPGKTLYEMVTSIQKHLHQNNLNWKLLDECEFREVKNVLDNVMKERAEQNIGTVPKQASFIPNDIENRLWEKKLLGEDTPDKLRDTVLFLLGMNLGLRAGDEHYQLYRDSLDRPSQLSFERASNGKRCLVYREDTVTKTNDGGLASLKKERKVVWVFPSENPVRCPVRIVDKYMSLIPAVTHKTKKHNFYLCSLEKPNPAQWYGEQVVGRHTLTKVVGQLLKDVNPGVFYSNHSLRRSGTTRLFQAGVDRKIVKEFTGHSSDAVDKYQITSEKQKEELSKIIGGEHCLKKSDESQKLPQAEIEVTVKNSGSGGEASMECKCKKEFVNMSKAQEIGNMVSSLVNARKSGKAIIRLEIEFSD